MNTLLTFTETFGHGLILLSLHSTVPRSNPQLTHANDNDQSSTQLSAPFTKKNNTLIPSELVHMLIMQKTRDRSFPQIIFIVR